MTIDITGTTDSTVAAMATALEIESEVLRS
jgi:hypothetical protein